MMIFPFPAGNSRRRRRLKKPGALAPGFTGVWGRSATNKHAPGIYRGIACRYFAHSHNQKYVSPEQTCALMATIQHPAQE